MPNRIDEYKLLAVEEIQSIPHIEHKYLSKGNREKSVLQNNTTAAFCIL